MAFIEVRDLKRTYRTLDGTEIATEQKVFDGLDLDVAEGELVAVVGPSGCGKSTLLNMIGGLDLVDKRIEAAARRGTENLPLVEGGGAITIGDFPISQVQGNTKADFINRNIGFVFQFHHLIPELTALDNVALPTMIQRQSRRKARAAALEMLAKVNLAAHAGKRPSVLSGGEKQRVAIARALINRPRLLLADEPTGSLDPSLKGAIFDLLRRLNREDSLTIILVTHDIGLLYDSEKRLKTDRIISLAEAKERKVTDSSTKRREGP